MKTYKLPTIGDGFLWGGSLSAVQVDGIGEPQRSQVFQDYLFKKYPERHWSGIGPTIAIDFTRRYQEDIKMYQKIGINSIRYGFQWSRLFPNGKTLNQKAVKLYHNIIDDFNNANIEVIMQLFHFDTPIWVKNLGGWQSKKVQKRFGDFAAFCFREYGTKVKRFATFNEPAVMKSVFESPDYWNNGKVSTEKTYSECVGILIANAVAYYQFDALKKKGLLSNNVKLGVVVNYNKSYPADPKNPSKADLRAVRFQDAFENQFWTDGLVIGKINKLVKRAFLEQGFHFPITKQQEHFISKISLDFIGENYYLPWRARARSKGEQKKNPPSPSFNYYKASRWKNARMNHFRKWEIFPEGLTGALIDLHNLYGREIYVAENGVGVANESKLRNKSLMIADEYRISYAKEHIIAMKKAMQRGVKVFGYHIWSMSDLWSSYNGFKNRYGLVEVDLDQNLKRSLKKSALWYKKFIRKGTIASGFKKCDDIISQKMHALVPSRAEMKTTIKTNYDLIGEEYES